MLGRHPEAVALLVDLAEMVGIPVYEPYNNRINFPLNHPLHLGASPGHHLSEADVIVCIDVDVPYIPVAGKPSAEAKIISIDIDPLKQAIPLWGFPVDIPILADSSLAIPAIYQMVQWFATSTDRARYEERRRAIEAEHNAQREQWLKFATDTASQVPITPDWLSHVLSEFVDDNTIVVNESVMSSGSVVQQINFTRPGSLYGSAGSSLGWGVPAALGAKLASPDKTVICLSGDGSFVFADPTAALWSSRRYEAPFLTIIYDNGRYGAVEMSLRAAYPQGYAVKTDNFNGASLEPRPRYENVAKALDAYAETVTLPSEVRPAIERGLAAVRNGQSAVLDVIVGWPATIPFLSS